MHHKRGPQSRFRFLRRKKHGGLLPDAAAFSEVFSGCWRRSHSLCYGCCCFALQISATKLRYTTAPPQQPPDEGALPPAAFWGWWAGGVVVANKKQQPPDAHASVGFISLLVCVVLCNWAPQSVSAVKETIQQTKWLPLMGGRWGVSRFSGCCWLRCCICFYFIPFLGGKNILLFLFFLFFFWCVAGSAFAGGAVGRYPVNHGFGGHK